MAVLRGDRVTTLADAIHVATARAFGATCFVTSDRRLGSPERLRVVYLDSLGVSMD